MYLIVLIMGFQKTYQSQGGLCESDEYSSPDQKRGPKEEASIYKDADLTLTNQQPDDPSCR